MFVCGLTKPNKMQLDQTKLNQAKPNLTRPSWPEKHASAAQLLYRHVLVSDWRTDTAGLPADMADRPSVSPHFSLRIFTMSLNIRKRGQNNYPGCWVTKQTDGKFKLRKLGKLGNHNFLPLLTSIPARLLDISYSISTGSFIFSLIRNSAFCSAVRFGSIRSIERIK